MRKGQVIFIWDPYNISIMAEQSGYRRLEGMVEGVTMRVDINPDTGLEERVITEHKHDLHPQITILGKDNEVLSFATIPAETHVVVQGRPGFKAGDLAREDPASVQQDQGHHRRSSARGRALRSPPAEGSGGHQPHRRSGRAGWRHQGHAQSQGRPAGR
jgi:hypothetical protein